MQCRGLGNDLLPRLSERAVPLEKRFDRSKSYGAGMVERVRSFAGGTPDLIFDAGPISDVLPDLVKVANDARRIVTVSNHGPAAEALGVRNSFEGTLAYGALGEFAKLAAEGRFKVPVARSFPLMDWRSAMDLSLARRAHGKLMLTLDL